MYNQLRTILSNIRQHGFHIGLARYFIKTKAARSKVQRRLFKFILQHTRFLNDTIRAVIRRLTLTELLTKVYAESTNDCNANCIMCRRNKMTRGIGTMKFDLFRKIADECLQLDIPEMRFHNFGEPLLDDQLSRKIEYAKNEGIRSTALYTNGSLLNEQQGSKLLESGLDQMFISFDGATAATYQKIRRNLHFVEVRDNIKNFISQRNNAGRIKPALELSIVPSSLNKDELTDFQNYWHRIADQVNVSRLHNFAENSGTGRNQGTKIPCYMLWRSMFILWNGDVSICCMDYNGTQIVGNIEKQSIFEVWQSERFREVRMLNMNNQYEFCKKCEINDIQSVTDQIDALKSWI